MVTKYVLWDIDVNGADIILNGLKTIAHQHSRGCIQTNFHRYSVNHCKHYYVVGSRLELQHVIHSATLNAV